MNDLKQNLLRLQNLIGDAFSKTGSLLALVDSGIEDAGKMQRRLETIADDFERATLELRRLCERSSPGAGDYMRKLRLPAVEITGSVEMPPPADHPEWDAIFQSTPLVMAVDMELRRIDAAIRSAKEEGLGQVSIVALKEQAPAVLSRRYRDKGLARFFTLAPDALATLGDMTLYTPSRRQYETPEGDVIDAPLIQADRKGGRQGRK